MTTDPATNIAIIEATGRIVASIAPDFQGTLTNLITDVRRALTDELQPAAPAEPERPAPAVPIRKSITPDYLVCLEDGQRFKSLKRHLRTHYNLTPEEYRERWGLPADYPMVAPNYTALRSKLAKDAGLGTKGRA